MKCRRRKEVTGEEVINGDAMKLGVTKDLAWSSEGHLALVIESDEEDECFLSFDDIEKISDVVVVRAKSAQTIFDRPTKMTWQTKT
jgi:sporulation protein YlmC with PRC-barrel domain